MAAISLPDQEQVLKGATGPGETLLVHLMSETRFPVLSVKQWEELRDPGLERP